MAASLLITLRETLEASLVVGIILAFLHRTQNHRHDMVIWLAVVTGVLLSLILMIVFQQFAGGFTGRAEQLYEGIMMLTAAGLVTWMVIWMSLQGRKMRAMIEQKVETHIVNDHPLGLFMLTLVSVLREGIETVIFLQAAFLQSQSAFAHIGAIAGIVLAVSLGYLLFKCMRRVPLQTFFRVTSILLLLFAAGLVAHGIHELQEAAVIPIIVEHVWDTNWLLHEKGTVGSLLKGLFGYNGNPSLIEVFGYIAYLTVASLVMRKMSSTR